MDRNATKYLSEHLIANNKAIYIWYVDEDRLEWTGDFSQIFGDIEEYKYFTFMDFNKLINQKDQADRLLLFNKMLDDFEKYESLGKTASVSYEYSIRSLNGDHINVYEHATLHRYKITGQKLICASLLLDNHGNQCTKDKNDNEFIPSIRDEILSGFDYVNRDFKTA
jgi:hypothetical protein